MFAAKDDAAGPFVTAAFKRGQNRVVTALLARTPFIAITGKAGSGRTTLLDAALSSLGGRPHVVWASAAGDRPLDLGTLLARLVGKPEGALRNTDLKEAFAALTEANSASVLRVLVIEGAENAPPDLLGHLLLLSTLLGTRSALLQVVLVGPPNLREMLHPEIARRINAAGAHVAVEPMSDPDSRSYVERRLRLRLDGVAANGALASGVVDEIVRAGGGNPGTLDRLLALELDEPDRFSAPRRPPVRPGASPAFGNPSNRPQGAPPVIAKEGGRASMRGPAGGVAEGEWSPKGSIVRPPAVHPTPPPTSGRRAAWLFASAALVVVAVGGTLALVAGWDPRPVASPRSPPPPAYRANRASADKAVPQPLGRDAELDARGLAGSGPPAAGPVDQARSDGRLAVSPPAERLAPLAPPPGPSPASEQPPVSDTLLRGSAAVPAPAPQSALSPETIAALMKRGEAMLDAGDIAAARLLFERAATGSVAAAVLAGKTFDPAFLTQIGARGIKGDPDEAAKWYIRASAAGNQEANDLLVRLRAADGQQ